MNSRASAQAFDNTQSVYRRRGFLEEFWQYRALLKNLVLREIKVRHKQSVLGLAWTVLSPLITTTILAVVFAGFFGMGLGRGSFALYVISGLVLWNLYSSATQSGLASIFTSSPIIRKVYVPKAVFPVASVLSSLVSFGFSLIALFIYMALAKAPLRPATFLAIIPILELTVLSTGISMLLATLYVYFRDIRWFYESALMALFYASPVFYPPEVVGARFSHLLAVNPLWPILASFRTTIINGEIPNPKDIAFGGASAAVFLAVGIFFIRRHQDQFINYV
ncbi:MAG TPA: ABC transporter permease [Blastocatellia bacterium]|nr:ABC transporter permease [Blastocatellia bacterium]